MIDINLTRQLWAELHEYAGQDGGQDRMSFLVKWLEKSERVLGCPSCWWKVKRFLRHWPVTYDEDFWLWAICLHDYVNKEMGKPLFHPELTLAPLLAKGILQ